VAQELLPLSEHAGRCMWIELADCVRACSELVVVSVAGAATEAVVCEGAWHDASAGGPRSSPSWCINPQYWVTVAKDAALTIELSQPDVRLAPVRHAASSTAQAAAGGELGEVDEADRAAYAPVSVCVMRGGPPSTMDYGRMWYGERDVNVMGETRPAKRRAVGITVHLQADRAYCIVPCCLPGVLSPFVLRLQSETSFTLKQ
jgi:hypothetical protein